MNALNFIVYIQINLSMHQTNCTTIKTEIQDNSRHINVQSFNINEKKKSHATRVILQEYGSPRKPIKPSDP